MIMSNCVTLHYQYLITVNNNFTFVTIETIDTTNYIVKLKKNICIYIIRQ